jgi:hypothetical protein
MDFDNALWNEIITRDEYDLLVAVDEMAKLMESDCLASSEINEILERVWQFENRKLH